MTSKTKIIGISNRIHLNLLESVLADYLHTGIFHKEEYLNLISQYNEGQNRAGKVVSHLSSIITKNKKLLTFLKKHLGEDVLLNLSKSEKRSLYTCLLCNAFPIIYDILIIAAQTLTIQESISKQVIIQKISATYGSNRSTDIAVSETLTI